jgi:hypothetical protein
MSRKISVLLVVLASLGLAAGGCGSSSSSNKSTSTSSTPAPASTGSSGGSSGGGVSAANKAGVDACKQSISAQPTLTASDKTSLGKVCEKAANGDVAGVKKATRTVCETIVKRTAPAGPARTTALQACATATK